MARPVILIFFVSLIVRVTAQGVSLRGNTSNRVGGLQFHGFGLQRLLQIRWEE
jgi:hypothetical protein